METIYEIYNNLFPHTGMADWFYALLGMLLHALVKLKNIPLGLFKWKIFFEEFAIVWFISFLTIFICLGTLPIVLEKYNTLDSALIGYSSSSLLKSIFKTRRSIITK
jgi:hypothetical protein